MENKISYNLKSLRKQQKLRQSDLAIKLNVSRQTVSSWENGRNTPDINTLMRLAHVYHISLNQLVFENTVVESPAHRINKGIFAVLFLILFIERMTVDAPPIARIWIDWIMFSPVIIAGMMFIVERSKPASNFDQFVYLGGLIVFVLMTIFSSLINLFSMGIGFQTVCFICGSIALGRLLYSYFKTNKL